MPGRRRFVMYAVAAVVGVMTALVTVALIAAFLTTAH